MLTRKEYMSIEKKQDYLNRCNKIEKLAFSLASTCAPVIRGLTVSNTLSVKQGEFKIIQSMLKGTPLNCFLLYAGKIEIVLIARMNKLQDHLKQNEVKDYLIQFGYEDVSIDYVIEKLYSRFYAFYIDKQVFPHELGLILSYPIDDIKGFIENDGKKELACKYWKVYSNLDDALKKFKAFDEAIETCLYQIVNGYKLKEIIVGG